MSSNRPPVEGAELHGPPHLTEADVVRRRQAKEQAARQRDEPVAARTAWRDRDFCRAAFLLGSGYSFGEIGLALGRPPAVVYGGVRSAS